MRNEGKNCNKFASNILDAKITQKKIVNQSGSDEKKKNIRNKRRTKNVSNKGSIKVDQDKMVKLQTNDLSLFIGQIYVGYHGKQNYLVFQSLYAYIKRIGSKDNISTWKFKGLSEEIIKKYTTANNSLAPSLVFINKKIRVKFDSSCLKQKKIHIVKKKE